MQAMAEIFSRGAAMASRNPKAPRYYDMHWDYRGGVPCFELANKESLQADDSGLFARPVWPDGYARLPRHPYRFPVYLEPPRLLFDKKSGRPARDLEGQDGLWYVSRAMKKLLECIDPQACEFRKCDTVWVSGEPGPEYWLCSVTRLLNGWDVIDFGATRGLIQHTAHNGLPYYSLSVLDNLRFKPEAIGSSHLFRVIGLGDYVFCDQIAKDACVEAGLKGITFRKTC